jgi:arabinofuranan 3-O-arabinosyltransferase
MLDRARTMTVYETAPARGTLSKPVELIGFGLIVAQLVYLTASYVQGSWLTGASGTVPNDFVDVWAAGQLVVQGNPAAVYDWPTHKAMEVIALGHPFHGYFGWHYPPTYLPVAALLAKVSYIPAQNFFLFSTFLAYMFCLRKIVGENFGYLFAAAFPAVLANVMAGQNGFLSAALLGGTLLALNARPILAGVLLGLLTYKPHLGLLLPVALAAGGYWRAFVTAGIAAAVMALASWAAFGSDTWHAFFANIGHTSQAFLGDGWADFGKLQTAFGLVRTLGGGEPLAWSVQGTLALSVAVAVAVLWRSRAEYDLKAAALATGALLATPYLYMYDLMVLAVPLAFLWRLGRAKCFLPHETAGIGFACLLVLIFPQVKAPVGFAAVLVVAALIAYRAWPSFRRSAQAAT